MSHDLQAVRVALYTRVSTDNQANKDEGSLDTQEARLRGAIIGRAGPHQVVGVFREEGLSGKNLERPQLQKMLDLVRLGAIDLVMVTRIDRLSRSLTDFYELHRLFEEHQVQFVSLNETFDTSNAVGRAMLKLLLVFAELEREQTGERTRAAMRARAERGLWNGGHPPLGYDSAGGGHLNVNEEEAALLRAVFDRYLELRSAPKLAAWLNEQGHRQKRYDSTRKGATGGRRFSTAAVLHMLRNRLYLGEIPYKDQTFNGHHPAIVGQQTFDRVQAVLAGNAKHRRGPPLKAQYDYLLTGIARCSCGFSLTTSAGTGRGGKLYPYYRCVGVSKAPSGHDCRIKQVGAEDLEREVLDVVRQAARDPELQAEAAAEANRMADERLRPLRERVDTLRRDLEQVEAQAHQVFGQILRSGLGESTTARQVLEELEARARQLRQAHSEAEGELAVRETDKLDQQVVGAALAGFDRAFAHLDVAEKRELLRLMIKQVVVHPDHIEVELYEGTRACRMLRAAVRGVRGGVRGAEGDREQNDETPTVKPGFVLDSAWLPTPEAGLTGPQETLEVDKLWPKVESPRQRRLRQRAERKEHRLRHPPAKDALEKVLTWQAEIDAGDMTRAGIARREGLSRARVTQLMKLLDLPEQVKMKLLEGDPEVQGMTMRNAVRMAEPGS
ncbi:MAG: recombinase family protein [Pseudomonadota bacterium]